VAAPAEVMAVGPPVRPHPLPTHLTPFLGRVHEIAAVGQFLRNAECRLLTIVGPGGMGKTRLAVQAAVSNAGLFSGGVAFVSLAPVDAPERLAPAILEALQLPVSSALPPLDQVVASLSVAQLLLVLDNMEHLLEASETVVALLQECPQVKILVTSRQRLGLQEEWVLDLEGLPLPRSLEEIDQAGIDGSALDLFVQAARRANSSYVLTPAEMEAALRVCQLVEGMPLGIEIAATWARVLSATEIAAEIERNLDFLTTAHRNMPARHRSMRAVFEQSWQLLSEEEQQFFCRLALLRGGFRREAAEQVGGAGLAKLLALADKSLLRRRDDGRFEMHELIRQYALNRLKSLPSPLVEQSYRAFAGYFAQLAQTAEPLLVGPDQRSWLDRLEQEHDNFRAALAWALEAGEYPLAAEIGAALARFWWLRGHANTSLHWLEQVIEHKETLPEALRAKSLLFAALLARVQANYAQATTWILESEALRRQLGDSWGVGQSLNELAMVSLDQGQLDEAHQYLSDALQIAKAHDFTRGVALSYFNLGIIAHYRQQLAEAEALFGQALAAFRALSAIQNVAMSLIRIGLVLLDQEKHAEAAELFAEALQLSHGLRFLEGIAWALLGMASVRKQQGRWQEATSLLAASEALRSNLNIPIPPVNRAQVEQLASELHRQLGPHLYAAARQIGLAMDLQKAIAYAGVALA
jgi:predicted ATPase/Tfp pilus assembly protein PilF